MTAGSATKLLAVYTTVDKPEAARAMARALVERKLAACAQIDGIESFYAWKGELQDEAEVRILFKTTADRYHDVAVAIREMHPYELPAIHAVEIAHADPAYARWVGEGSSSARSEQP